MSNFSANAEVGFDVSDFLSSGVKVEEILQRIEDAANIFSDAVDRSAQTLKDMGSEAKAAAQQVSDSEKAMAKDAAETYRLKAMYEKEAKNDQRDTLRLKAMYEKEAQAKVIAEERATAKVKEQLRKKDLADIRDTHRIKAMYAKDAAKATADAERAEQAAHNKQQANLSNARYALYDVSTAFTAVSAAALGSVGAISAVGIAFERDFAQVARTSGLTVQSDIEALRESLVSLSQDIPVDFASIASIGTLAGQLGVAAEDIANFTEVVAMFSASTNVSVEKSAEDIGRVAQLTGVAGEEYENLASSIYQVGVTSVATESAILETATNISTAGNLAGLTAAEVVALSGAFASLGVAPERARGSVQRVFGELTEAASEGGEQLDAFAKLSGMSADEFASSWKNEPQAAFNAFVQGLQRAKDAGSDTNAMLKDLGISAVRDIQALQVLANNFDVYADAQTEANNGFVAGTALSEGYAIVAETTAAKLQKLSNNFKALFDSMSNSEIVGTLVDGLIKLIQNLDALVSIPGAKYMFTLVGGVVAAVGVFTLYQAVLARTTASAFASRTAMQKLSEEGVSSSIGIRSLVSELVQMAAVLNGTNVASAKASKSLATVGTSAKVGAADVASASTTIAASNATVATTSATAATGLRGMGLAAGVARGALSALGKVFVPLAIATTALTLGTKAWEAYSKATESAGDRAKRVYGDLDGLAAAVRKDTAEWTKYNAQVAAGEKITNEAAGSYKTMEVSVSNNARTLNASAQALSDNLGVTLQMTDANSDLTDSTKTQTVALGENAKMWLYNQYATGENFKTLKDYFVQLSSFDVPELASFDIGEMIAASLDPESGGALAYLDAYIAAIRAKMDGFALMPDATLTDDEVIASKELEIQYMKVNEVLGRMRGTAGDTGAVISTLGAEFEAGTSLAKAFGVATDEAGDGADKAGDKVKTLADSFKELAAPIDALAATQEALAKLGDSVGKNGVDFDAFSEGGRANISALSSAITAMADQAGGDVGVFNANLLQLLHDLENTGINTRSELGYVWDMLASVTDGPWVLDLNSAEARADLRQFIVDSIAAIEARAALERNSAMGRNSEAFARNPSQGNMNAPVVSTEQADAYQKQADALKALLAELDKQSKATKDNTNNTNTYRDAVNNAKKATDSDTTAKKKNTKATKEAAKEVRTYADYASDLAAVLDRAFELQFGEQMAADDVLDAQDAVNDVYARQNDYIAEQRQNILDAEQSIREYAASINSLKADITGMKASNKVLEHQLKLARMYGDTLAEANILAKIDANNAGIGEAEADITGLEGDAAKANEELLKASDELALALRDLELGLEGNGKFARELRDAYWDLMKAQDDEIIQMAANGASQADMKKKVDEHKAAVRDLGKAYGESPREIKKMTDAVGDTKKAIDLVPKNVTVKLVYTKDGEVDPIASAYKEMVSKKVVVDVNAKKDKSVDTAKKAYDALKNKTVAIKAVYDDAALAKAARAEKLKAGIARARYDYEERLASNQKDAAAGYKSHLDTLVAELNSGKYYSGGFTGRGGKYDAAGTVHKGEFVIPKEHVNQSTGIPDMSALGFMFKGMTMPAKNTNAVRGNSNGIQLVEILPNQLQALIDASKVLVNLDLNSLTKGVNAVNEQNNVRGSR